MARVLGIHEIELRPGTDPAEFEKAAAEVVLLPGLDGWRTEVLRGQRGPRTDRYMIIFQIESVAARDRYFPQDGPEPSAEADRFDAEHPETAAAWERFAAMFDFSTRPTDYELVAG